MLKIALLLIFGVEFATTASAAEPFGLPLGARLEGVGLMYGGVAGARDAVFGQADIWAGALFGEVKAQGIAIGEIPIGVENVTLNLGYGHLSEANLDTSYVRGLSTEHNYRQRLAGAAYGALLEGRYLDKKLKVHLGYAFSSISLKSYFNENREIEIPSRSGLHDVNTGSKILGLSYQTSTSAEATRFKAALQLATAEGRAGQSDQLTTTYSASGYIPVSDRVELTAHTWWSDAYLLKKQDRYVTSQDVRQELGLQCSQATNASEQSRCADLENSLADYVAQNNQHGTAAPLGGSNGLRNFSELSLRSAHTRLLSFEPRLRLAQRDSLRVELAPFMDIGWSLDSESQVFRRAQTAYGGALRVLYKDFPLRLSFARSDRENAYFLAMGQNW